MTASLIFEAILARKTSQQRFHFMPVSALLTIFVFDETSKLIIGPFEQNLR